MGRMKTNQLNLESFNDSRWRHNELAKTHKAGLEIFTTMRDKATGYTVAGDANADRNTSFQDLP